jgi:hypothetical protein
MGVLTRALPGDDRASIILSHVSGRQHTPAMAFKQKRKVVLQRGRKRLTLELGQGHVWEIHDDGSTGHPLYDEKEERALFDRLLTQWHGKGYRVVSDTGLVKKAAPKKPAEMPARTWRWINDVDQVLHMWRDGDYDNEKDIILDARDLLTRPPPDEKARIARLEKVLATAESQLRRSALRDPSIAEYAKGLVNLDSSKKKPGKRAASKKKR